MLKGAGARLLGHLHLPASSLILRTKVFVTLLEGPSTIISIDEQLEAFKPLSKSFFQCDSSIVVLSSGSVVNEKTLVSMLVVVRRDWVPAIVDGDVLH